MSAPGSYINPSSKPCWETCGSCYRCANKGRYTKCNSCSGRHDPAGMVDTHPDDFCLCTQGVLRYRHQSGQLIIRRFDRNPFAGSIIQNLKTQDEADFEAYVDDLRERFDNPNLSPIQMVDDHGNVSAYDESSYFKYLGND